jgi:hypothetical protein
MITPSVVRTVRKQRYSPQKQSSGHHFIYLEDYVIQRRMNKQSGFNVEKIEKDNYPESKTVWILNLKWQVNATKAIWLINQQVITREDYISLKFSNLFIDLRLVVSIQTNHMCHITSTQLRDYFFPIQVFLSLIPCWFFICGGEWHKPPRKVSYKRSFGASDQGQTLDVWHWHQADANAEVAVTPGVTTSLQKDTLNTTRYLRRNQCQSIRSYKLDLRLDSVQRLLCTLTPI